ncbi:unnamed protein product [Rhizoctonia solani]|uniref:Uncharacterized protein n=1 Tax=Rhizoctonia solani TaxID=456999 RepID=A0A8H3B0N5_9AGAM|nr:unnamed protein product [Rhizoctonia solani]
MSLDINLVIILVVSMALVLEVLTVVVYVFQNYWTFDKPRTYRNGNSCRGSTPGAYNDVWTMEVIGAVKKYKPYASRRVVNLPSSSSRRELCAPPRARTSGLQLIPSGDLLYKFVAWLSSQMSTFSSRAASTAKPEHTVGNPETSVLAFTRVEPTIASNSATKNDLTTPRIDILGTNPKHPLSSGPSILHRPKRTQSSMLTRTFLSTTASYNLGNRETATLSATTNVLKVSAVKKSQVPTYSSLPPTASVCTGVITQAEPQANAGCQLNGGSDRIHTLRSSKAPKISPGATRDRAHSVATASHGQSPAKSSTSTSILKTSIPSGLAVRNNKNSSNVVIKPVYQEVMGANVLSNPAVSGIAHSEPEARLVQSSCTAPDFASLIEPLPLVPVKRRLRAGATKAVRPTKRRRLAYAEDERSPLIRPTNADVPSTLVTTSKRNHADIFIPSPIPALTPPSSPTSDTYLTSASSPTSDIPTTPLEPTVWKDEICLEVDVSGVHKSNLNEPSDGLLSRIVVSDTVHTEFNTHTFKGPHFTSVPASPTPPKSIIPAKRRSPVKSSESFQTKRRRTFQAEADESYTSFPSTDLANFRTPSLSPPQKQPIHPPNMRAINSLPLFSEPTFCSSSQSTSQSPPSQACDLITHLIELTRGRTEIATTPTPDQSNSLVISALGPKIGTSMSSSGKPGAPPRACSSAQVVSRASIGEGSNDVNMDVLNAMFIPDVTMSSSTANSSASSTYSPFVSRMDLGPVEVLETMAKTPEIYSLDGEQDVEMDPDSLMDDGSRSGFIQRHMATANNALVTTLAIVKDTTPIVEGSAEVMPEEVMEDLVNQGGRGVQEDVQEPVTEDHTNAPIGPDEEPQRLANLVQTFADMQVGSVAEEGTLDQSSLEMEPTGEHGASTQAATTLQTLESEPVIGRAQALSDLQVGSADGETGMHYGVVGQPNTFVYEPDILTRPDMQVGTAASTEVTESTTPDPSHSVPLEEYVEDPLDALIQGLVTTHLPAPIIVPYEPESTNIGVDNTVAGSTGSDFISLGFGDDEGEEESEGEEEILVRTLHSCDYLTIIRFSLTCKKAYEIVSTSVSLQIHIELDINGLEIADGSSKGGPNYSLALKELRDYRDAWLNLRLGPMVRQQIGTVGYDLPNWGLRSNTHFGEFRVSEPEHDDDFLVDSTQITVIGASNASPPTNYDKKFNFCIMDPKQDLVVLVEDECLNSGSSRFHIYSTTTGRPHSLAAHPSLTVNFDEAFLRKHELTDELMSADPEIMGNYLVVKFDWRESDCGISEILLWDWRVGVLLARVHSEHSSARHVFLDKQHLLVYSALPSNELQSTRLALLVYRIPTITQDFEVPSNAEFSPYSYPEHHPILIFELPELSPSWEITGVHFMLESELLPGDVVYAKSATLLCSRITTLGLGFRIWNNPRGEHYMYGSPKGTPTDYHVFVNTHRIFTYITERRSEDIATRTIPWSQWGTLATRWFMEDDTTEHLSVTVYGSQHIRTTATRKTNAQIISIVDFNTPLIMRHEYNSSITSRARRSSADKAEKTAILEGKGMTAGRLFQTRVTSTKLPIPGYGQALNQEVLAEMVGGDMKTVIRKGFKEPVESCLPYRVVTKVQRMPLHGHWRVHGEYLAGPPRRNWSATEAPSLTLCKIEPSSRD